MTLASQDLIIANRDRNKLYFKKKTKNIMQLFASLPYLQSQRLQHVTANPKNTNSQNFIHTVQKVKCDCKKMFLEDSRIQHYITFSKNSVTCYQTGETLLEKRGSIQIFRIYTISESSIGQTKARIKF